MEPIVKIYKFCKETMSNLICAIKEKFTASIVCTNNTVSTVSTVSAVDTDSIETLGNTISIKSDIEQDQTTELIERLNDTKMRLEALRNAFEFETDFNMIDAYIMEMSGLEKQYSCLLTSIRRLHGVA